MATPIRNQPTTGACDTASTRPWKFDRGDGPVVATAIHSGHEVRPDVAEWLAISEADRLREEALRQATRECGPGNVVKRLRGSFRIFLAAGAFFHYSFAQKKRARS